MYMTNVVTYIVALARVEVIVIVVVLGGGGGVFGGFFFNDTATTEIYTLSLHDALPISIWARA